MGKNAKQIAAARAALVVRRKPVMAQVGRLRAMLLNLQIKHEMNAISQQKATDVQVRRRMEKLLQWDAGQMNECEYSQGIAWLDTVFGKADGPEKTQPVRRKLEGSKGFWVWWKNQWANLDGQMSPNLKVALVAGEWMLGYYAPNLGPTYYNPATWKGYYQRRHADYMAVLRPDDDTLKRILLAA